MSITTKDRLKFFSKENGFGQNTFEKHVGIAIGYLSSKSKSITSDTIERVYEKFPDLNLEWLITGKGDMFKSTSIIGNKNITGNNNLSNTGSIGGHNIQISDPNPVHKKIVEDKDFKMTYESLPDDFTQHKFNLLLDENRCLKEENNSLLKELNETQRELIGLLKHNDK